MQTSISTPRLRFEQKFQRLARRTRLDEISPRRQNLFVGEQLRG